MIKSTILIVDDEVNIRQGLQFVLKNEGYSSVYVAVDAISAMQILCERKIDLAFIDIRLGSISGIDLFRKIKEEGLETIVVFISGNASLTEAVKSVQEGAYDFLEKPISAEKLTTTVKKALDYKHITEKLREIASHNGEGAEKSLIGEDPALQRLKKQLMQVASTDATVFISGESGTGKELLAQIIHENSNRKSGPFVKVNCSAIPETLVESEFFGHIKGAFTGAHSNRSGYFEKANYGTIFLDEIGDMSLVAQTKILRCLNNQEIQKVGANQPIKIDVRIIAATNKDLLAMVKTGTFREDLFYRINVVPLKSIALRDLASDIPLLVGYFVDKFCQKHGRALKQIDEEAMAILKNYPWPGNVRELKNIVERMVIMSGDTITGDDIPSDIEARRHQSAQELPTLQMQPLVQPLEGELAELSLKKFRDESERGHIVKVLSKTSGNISEAARLLEIERSSLHKKMIQFAIQKKEYFI